MKLSCPSKRNTDVFQLVMVSPPPDLCQTTTVSLHQGCWPTKLLFPPFLHCFSTQNPPLHPRTLLLTLTQPWLAKHRSWGFWDAKIVFACWPCARELNMQRVLMYIQFYIFSHTQASRLPAGSMLVCLVHWLQRYGSSKYETNLLRI